MRKKSRYHFLALLPSPMWRPLTGMLSNIIFLAEEIHWVSVCCDPLPDGLLTPLNIYSHLIPSRKIWNQSVHIIPEYRKGEHTCPYTHTHTHTSTHYTLLASIYLSHLVSSKTHYLKISIIKVHWDSWRKRSYNAFSFGHQTHHWCAWQSIHVIWIKHRI